MTTVPRIRATALIIKNSQVLLIKRHNDEKDYWVFPGGGIEPDESVETAARREVYEETSLKVTKIISEHHYTDPLDKFKHHFIVCEVEDGKPTLGGEEAKLHSAKDSYVPMWVNIPEALSLHNLYPAPVKDYLRELVHEAHRS